MPLREDLLTPIASDNPGGSDVRYEPIYDQIKEARREDIDLPQGGWEAERKAADPALVVKLASEVLAKRSKDLQVAAWLTEAQLRREGFTGLHESLELIQGLLDQFWDHLYPELEDGDAEFRAAPLDWVGSRLGDTVRTVPLNRSGHSYVQYMESRTVGYEDQATTSEQRQARNEAIAQGKLTPEDFDAAATSTPKDWYKQVLSEIDASLATINAVDEIGREKFGDVAPGYGGLRGALEEVRRVASQLLAKKLEVDPDPVELDAIEAAESAADGALVGAVANAEAAALETAAGASGGTLAAEPGSPADAAARVVSAARFLRRSAPANPAPYLLLRALRWGELRAGGDSLDPKLLEAPPSQVRSQLKALLLDRKWPQLLEAAEGVMATPAGRGWLDLQRYVVTACDELGDEYRAVRAAVLSEVRGLLADLPALPDLMMMDDLPTASPETRIWLVEEVLSKRGAQVDGDGADGALMLPPEIASANGNGNGRDRVWERAMAEVRTGRTQRAIELVSGELDRETSQRGRFLRRAQLAHLLVETGFDAVATPLLEQMVETIDTLKLDEWEAGPVVAQPMALLYRCIEKAEGDADTMYSLYLRLCRLDPVQAISVKRQ